MALFSNFVRSDKKNGVHSQRQRQRLQVRPRFECLETRTLMAAALPETLSAVASAQATAEMSAVQTADSKSMAVEYGTGVYVGQDDAGNTGGAADHLAGSFAWHEAYEDLQAVREIQRLAELRHAFEDPLGSDANAWSLGAEPGPDNGNLLDLPESPTDAGPGLSLGWGEGVGDGDPRDPQSMFPRTPDSPGTGEGGDGVAGALVRVGWVSDDKVIYHDVTQAGGGTTGVAVGVDSETGDTTVEIATVTPDGATAVYRSTHGPDGVSVTIRMSTPDGTSIEIDRRIDIQRGTDYRRTVIHVGSLPKFSRDTTTPIRPGEGDPSPTAPDDGWFSPLHPDAWATFLAWWTHRTGTRLGLPADDFGTGPADGSSSGGGSAAPRVGIDAVINPGGSDWAPSVPGGSSGDGDVNRPDDPFPPPPASK